MKEGESMIYEFTFQYGEIKSFSEKVSIHFKLKFTFQYGEIKSTNIGALKSCKSVIYIPVWRD